MQKELVTLADSATAGQSLTQIFLKNQHLYTVEQNDAKELVARAARKIEQLLRKRSAALEKLATAAEKLQMEHMWKDDFEVTGHNNTDPTLIGILLGRKYRIRPDFKEDPSFKRLTDYNHTAVHIPTDIYDGSTIVLNELEWSEALEEVFRKNRKDDPTLLWQVYGSATGLARYYPASPWMDSRKTLSKIDLYDVRRRPCRQIAARSCRVLCCCRRSGSVSGLTLKLIRTSVSEMLETLSDDDYVNVVYFNTRVKKTACFEHLVQANVRNKKLLKDAVQNITAKGITNYTKGFEFAFEQLSTTNVSRANCNKIIMLFTDGGEERAQAILEKYNAEKKVRIFTFSVGQHNYDKGPIQWMACSNKGYFYEIPSIGAIRINTQEYLDVLGRPMVLADKQAKQVQWTNVYLDALELGLVITGTLPVFNKTKTIDDRNGENQLILGVMGIDVSLNDIKKLTPRFTIGPNGYYFAIDPNGYVLLHPNLLPKVRCPSLRITQQNPKFQEPVTLDFLDAELENDLKVETRRMMIDGETGERTIDTLVKTQDERYIDRGVRTYTFAPVNGTDYSLALALPRYSEHFIQAKLGDDLKNAICKYSTHPLFDEFGYTYVAPREYCKELKLSLNNTEFLLDFSQYIDNSTPDACESFIFISLCAFAQLGGSGCFWRIVARFVATDGGITRVYPRSAGEEWTENPETYESSFYKRTLDNKIYIFTAPSFNSEGRESVTESGILVSKAVELTIDKVTIKPAGQSHCVILDDGGFLLMSNHDEYIALIGQFFGEVDPVLMINLVNTSLYSFNKTYDYQSICDPEKDGKAAAGPRSVYVVRKLPPTSCQTAAAPSLLQQLFFGLMFPNLLEAAESAEDDIPDAMFKESCITEQTQYFFDNNETTYSGVLDCGNCSRCVGKLPKTNLVFLITDAKATCLSCDPRPLRQAEQPSEGPDPCELAQNPRYRKGPDVCFDNNEDVRHTQTRSSKLLETALLVRFHCAVFLFGFISLRQRFNTESFFTLIYPLFIYSVTLSVNKYSIIS
uniref:Calcium voltage-gated channel auxiliary subunit alpha2delta 1 n=1 Tax=Gasterosteus aculeatus aculeatus TaxID=481459 RepID=A0AAQ4QSH0_GASAC